MIRSLCEDLVAAFELHGPGVRKNLRPGLGRHEILDIVKPTGIVLPEPVMEMYQWADGHIENEDDENTIVFRDNTFISLGQAVEQYFQMQSTYGGEEVTIDAVGVEFEKCFPISLNSGSWDTVACGRHVYLGLSNPIVRVFQGYKLYFDSVQNMLRTCIAWVSRPEWERFHGLREDIEREIWKAANPVRSRVA